MAAVCFAAVALLGIITPVAAQDAGVWMGDRRAAWLKEAAASMPELRRTEHHPVRIVRSVADSTAFQGWRMEPSEPIEALYASSLKQRRKVIVDMGEHMTGYFSLRVNHTGMPADAPIRLRITFAEDKITVRCQTPLIYRRAPTPAAHHQVMGETNQSP